jgi:hypothetical protein
MLAGWSPVDVLSILRNAEHLLREESAHLERQAATRFQQSEPDYRELLGRHAALRDAAVDLSSLASVIAAEAERR